MKLDFKTLSVEFVVKNNCALSTPATLIEQAMHVGAAEAVRQVTEKLKLAHIELEQKRKRNMGH